MKIAAIASVSFILGVVAHAIFQPTPPPAPAPAPVVVEVAAAPPAVEPEGTKLLDTIRSCVAELYPDKVGVGGSALRMDAMKITPDFRSWPLYEIPDGTPRRWYVEVSEETRRSIPSGAAFYVTPSTGGCGRAIMD